MAPNLDNLQGDLFSRGFPKLNETYYFFSVVEGKEHDFSKRLADLGKSGEISTLRKVLDDWVKVDKTAKDEIIPVSNALIAFTKSGLERIQLGLNASGPSLGLDALQATDPRFNGGMAADKDDFNDPAIDQWDALFNNSPIHGLLKVAGDCPQSVDYKLITIKQILGDSIADIAANSPPTNVNSRLDGHVRPQPFKGHEHFGFQDGISQPLLRGIDDDTVIENDKFMETAQNIVTLDTNRPPLTIGASPTVPRPDWMLEGSFLAFRKLEQDVKKFNDLTATKFEAAGCISPQQFGAKIVGRWESGAPVVLFPKADAPSDPTAMKSFEFKSNNVCPLGAHIRKTNPRDTKPTSINARIVRNGIPYGTEFEGDEAGKRGLLFACYQSTIENGFHFIQQFWVTNPSFPAPNAGLDPLIAQRKDDPDLVTTFFDESEAPLSTFGEFPRMVTMKGGDYFFVPSISALTDTLGSAA
ncbi:MAG: hypothetical protein M1814_002997 [Vezdaea aestivalis]|nr:MAG: hypothetical protein M1814_002997 [Vezdaea aestivalis]